MIAVVQRVAEAQVTIAGEKVGHIGKGLLILLGITHEDSEEDVQWLGKKIVGMRIFSDSDGKMNLDLNSVAGKILLVSQFTLHASTKKGNRPSFIEAAHPDQAIPLYESMKNYLSTVLGQEIACGKFGADMQVALINDGPVTILIDSKNRI
ncbi:D-aminoacyl-tRNA deacylase [Dyadobacter tibetensis]|uniref:D-aminoacyl-tRNA deacylase n=1 Tax=Dyadobacter tibetensis TaxID=1211851 RepID=UPI0004709063|nr:D-aminoacyl-tRNA deacylase [Dyadobacter tibetensis]